MVNSAHDFLRQIGAEGGFGMVLFVGIVAVAIIAAVVVSAVVSAVSAVVGAEEDTED